MSVTVTIPEGFQYVGGALLVTAVTLQGLSHKVSKYRKLSGIEYPQMYAEKSEAEKSRDALVFNCAQRAHQNTLEQIPTLFVAAVISGLKYPIPTAIATMVWNLSRISYARGYLTGDPKKRGGPVHFLGALGGVGLLVSSFVAIGGWILNSL
ncbi:hypothetical protein GALMADRAFT_272087 [Galerina marginata CBS 339.88]|uniref:Uncharacterized protein n=1 Tax=Galerina marginata (strain CBS 339.88) TaxID=685588 RepID=A0A067SND0_GALM3|nr:hypothetical protein GALMADRAFT_272087 [Galerina marginata CBS 339.88]